MYPYIILSPVRDEERYIARTIEAVTGQSVRPVQWIIVNDGSTDSTGSIVEEAAQLYPWINLVNVQDRGYASVGLGTVEAFLQGYEHISPELDYLFICKLDGDISLDQDYFERLLLHFSENEKLGVAGGTCFCVQDDRLHEEKMPPFHPPAAARLYRRSCYEDIGGIIPSSAWDTVDLLRARFRGWQVRRFSEPRIYHYRLMASRGGLWQGKVRTGRNFYLTGYSPVFVVARCIYRLFRKPYIVESAGVMYGYLKAMLNREPLAVSQEERAFLRREQHRRLLRFG